MGRNGPKIGPNASPLLGMVLAQKPQDGSKRLGASFFMQNQSVSIIVSPISRNTKAPLKALCFFTNDKGGLPGLDGLSAGRPGLA